MRTVRLYYVQLNSAVYSCKCRTEWHVLGSLGSLLGVKRGDIVEVLGVREPVAKQVLTR